MGSTAALPCRCEWAGEPVSLGEVNLQSRAWGKSSAVAATFFQSEKCSLICSILRLKYILGSQHSSRSIVLPRSPKVYTKFINAIIRYPTQKISPIVEINYFKVLSLKRFLFFRLLCKCLLSNLLLICISISQILELHLYLCSECWYSNFKKFSI